MNILVLDLLNFLYNNLQYIMNFLSFPGCYISSKTFITNLLQFIEVKGRSGYKIETNTAVWGAMIQTNTTSDNTNFFQVFGKEVVISKARYGNIWTLNTNNESISITGFWGFFCQWIIVDSIIFCNQLLNVIPYEEGRSINLQFLLCVIIVKTKVLLPLTQVTLADLGYPVVDILVFLPTKTFTLFDFEIFLTLSVT